MKGYYKITLAVQCFSYRDGDHTVEVEALGRGLLAISPRVWNGKVVRSERERVVTHILSGKSLGVFSGIRAARRALEAALDLADWRTVHRTGFTLEQRAELTRICRTS